MPDRTLLSRVVTALAVALPTVASAQQVDVRSLHEVDDDDGTSITYEGRSVEDLEDMAVVGSDGEKIGEIEEVLANANDEIAAVVVEYEDGFLDLGEREVVMPIDRLQFGQVGTEVTTAMGEQELRSLEVWDD